MSDLKALTGNIIDQAKAEAEQLVQQAAAEVERTLAAARQKAAERSAQITGEYQQQVDTVERRLSIEAELEGKKRVLAAKRQMVETVFQAALTALKQLPAEQRIPFLARKLAIAGGEHGGEVQAVGPNSEWLKIIKAANELIARSGKHAQLVLSNETPDVEGGFLLKGPGFTVDGSYQAFLSEIKDETVPEIAKYLFETEKR